MLGINNFFFIIIGAVCYFGLSCGQLSGLEYEIDKASPNGLYRVRIKVWAEKPKGTRDHTERAKVQFFKGQEVVHTYQGEESDAYEPSFNDLFPIIEWIDDNVLRFGKDRSNQPFYDELIVSNNTSERIKYLNVSYREVFWVFDLAAGSQIKLLASPGFDRSGTLSNYSLGYGGETESGKKFVDTIENKRRNSFADGRLEFQITINAKDLR